MSIADALYWGILTAVLTFSAVYLVGQFVIEWRAEQRRYKAWRLAVGLDRWGETPEERALRHVNRKDIER